MIKTRLIRLLSHSKQFIVLNVIWKWIGLLSQIVFTYSLCIFLEQVIYGALTKENMYSFMFIQIGSLIFKILSDHMVTRTSYLASRDVKSELRSRIYEKLLKLGASYREHVATGEVVQLAGEGVEQLETYFGRYLPQFFYSLLAPLTLYIVLAFTVDSKAALVLLVCVPLIPISIVVVQKITKRLLNKYWAIYAGLSDNFLENLQGLTTLKIYGTDNLRAKKMDEEAEHFRNITMKVLTMQLNSTSVMDIMAYGGAAIGMVIACSKFMNSQITFSGALIIILLSAQFYLPLRLLGSYFHIAMNGMAASDKIFALLDLEEPETTGVKLNAENISVVMKDVSFEYNKGQPVLKDVSLTIPSDGIVSLVGPSGCGKSTIAGLLTKENRGYEGSIEINGISLDAVDEADLLRNVVRVKHNSHIFKGSIRDNLLMACPGADDQRLEEVLKQVNLYDFVQKQNGLDTLMQEDGSNISGGQAQRLALARAILSDAKLFIFDEATSNIDSYSEALIMNVIRELSKTRAVLLISHRLYNVTGSKEIYMMDNGSIIEAGTHDRLLEKNGKYADMFHTQSQLEQYASDANEMVVDEPIVSLDRGQTEEEIVHKPFGIMKDMLKLVRPLAHVMLVAVVLGVVGYLCAIFLTILAAQVLKNGLMAVPTAIYMEENTWLFGTAARTIYISIIVMAVARGLLHYGEQYCNHYIAFKLLALIRHHVFDKLRTLAPAKLEGKDKGNLITLITSDIELLEVFYAHTISPIAIAFFTTLVMVIFISRYHILLGVFALCAYLVVGVLIPLYNSSRNGDIGLQFRNEFGALSSFVLDALRGIDETIQYNDGKNQLERMEKASHRLNGLSGKLSNFEGIQVSFTNIVITLASLTMLVLSLCLYYTKQMQFDGVITCTVAMMGSFGPVAALSSLSNNLSQTLASANRVLNLLKEKPQVKEVIGGENLVSFTGAKVKNVVFGYENQTILNHFSLNIDPDKIIGIYGPSGCGKSTLLRLLMRFWDVNKGSIEISDKDICSIQTSSLRKMEAYVTQSTVLFHDSIANNLRIANPEATDEQLEEACRKASIHDFIASLPQGYDTPVGELGDTLSGGERQRLGLARAFLHGSEFLLLDEPTSNLDALNEAMILKTLKEEAEHRTILLVSHRQSTLHIADEKIQMHTVE